MRVLILGHKGLLGNCLYKYFSKKEELEICVTDKRWPSQEFVQHVRTGKFDWIVNAIARVPQSKPQPSDLLVANVGLPSFLASLGSNIVHPSSNDLSGDTEYSLSKLSAERIIAEFPNVYIIRCSIIGIEEGSSNSLLSWFLTNDSSEIKGYTNHFWNGITTLTWAQICWELITQQRNERLLIPYSDTVSKYDLLRICNQIFDKGAEIVPVKHAVDFKVSADEKLYMGDINTQIMSLKDLYFSSQ